MTVNMKIMVFWDVTQCTLISPISLKGHAAPSISSILKMKAAGSFKALLPIYWTAGCHMLESHGLLSFWVCFVHLLFSL